MEEVERTRDVGVIDRAPTDPFPREVVRRPTMLHRWEDLTFAHWPYHPEAVHRLLPDGLRPHVFDGAAWVSLVLFSLEIRLPASMPPVPWIGTFLEANVRTYVLGPDGREGIWFLSLDAARLPAAIAARAWFRLPYMWARMRMHRLGDVLVYEARRRWPAPAGQRTLLVVEPERPDGPTELGAADLFLTARFSLWSPAGGGFARTLVEHPPWPLWRTRLLHVEDELLEAAGLPAPETPPLVHHSPSVTVRFGPRVRILDSN